MPSYRPVYRSTRHSGKWDRKVTVWHNRRKPWQARAKRGMWEWSLGYYATREEAIAAEDAFAEHYPKAKNSHGRHQIA